ncbi:MAG: serine hydrolase [Myxococcales bacterium]|nr:serine hydrolase [Myxococcales bacterium]
MCSGVFVGGLEPERVKREELLPQWFVSAEVDREAREVTSTLAGLAPRTAVYREGLGCTIAVGVTPDELRAATPEQPPRPLASELPWPRGDGSPSALDPEIDQDALAAALDFAFDDVDPARPLWTRAVVVAHRGVLVAERYAPGVTPETPLLGWSMTKSVTATFVGMLALDGALDVHAPAPVPQWRGDERAAITIDQLLRMSSGLEFEEVYGPLTDATAMLFESHDTVALPMAKPLAHAPDAVWSYSSGTTNILSWIVRRAVERDGGWPAYASFPRRRLFDPLGMRTAVIEPDASGTFVGSSFMYASARDWARFGLLHLQDGVWEGRRLLPEGWVEYVRTPTPSAPKGEYGAQWWTNVGVPEGAADRRFPSLPTDTFQASGYQGQAVVVIPSRELVFVRLGVTHDRSVYDLDATVARVLAALPGA